jgi:hypothetical protein
MSPIASCAMLDEITFPRSIHRPSSHRSGTAPGAVRTAGDDPFVFTAGRAYLPDVRRSAIKRPFISRVLMLAVPANVGTKDAALDLFSALGTRLHLHGLIIARSYGAWGFFWLMRAWRP